VVFSSGGGDGYYPTWVGRTADGEVACFLTDFFVLEDDEEDEPRSVEEDRTPATRNIRIWLSNSSAAFG
jgi:hypothetical protein